MNYLILGFLAGILAGVPLSGFLFGRWVGEDAFRGYLRRIAARRGWQWLLEVCTIGEALDQEKLAHKQVALLGECLERVRDLTYSEGLALGPARPGRAVLIDAEEEEGLLRPILIVQGLGFWKVMPLEEATPEAVLEALDLAPPFANAAEEKPSLGWLLAQVSDEQLQRLSAAQRTSLVHALLRDAELPGVVEGLVDRHLRAKAGQAVAS